MNNSIKFWDKIAESYSKQPIADETTYQKKLQVTREYFKPDMEVLEFGCGTGSTAIAHSPYVKHIRAIDFSSEMIEIARSKAEANKIENVTFEKLTIDELSVGDSTLDMVLGLNVLHLLKNKEEVIAKVYKMLKPGGVFVTSTVCLGDTMKWFKIVAPIGIFLGLIPMVVVFTTKELLDSLTDAGFKIDYHWQPKEGVSKGIFKLKGVFIVAKKDL
ncbi:class I SAM-dependent methyltransferase [Mastigocoleus sp. MO_188.B34]|uniref:class I SAM-dependent methyltransferase n=1 Tax=Mastigocoleus sp. MO_188.B34 TaxID=3036635 RepID=UPI00263359B1|nr:class I SAM-dependent methyltransferase [Mastigocoleus sp. MO_188.B34]MDJ0696420.1 class I SAM-dependent methyltransferase [Mastigocoleus sp. MO_188.B34]